ncbi:MAG: low temperature requirement protein A [Chloroflexi bacterium]|nr:low temperature requirement protein A [Chloroflexota bacterium]
MTGHSTIHQTDRAPSSTLARFKHWFWRRPRAHGDTILDRRVSPLESLYDLVYAVVISQAALPLEHHVSARDTMTFAVVFALIWIAWTDGSLYLELHGREDGRTRAFVFLQIGILALVAVFAADAAGAGGRPFALAYGAFLIVTTWMWYGVQRQDQIERPEFAEVTSRYVTALVLSVAVLLVSAVLPAGPRLIAWAALTVAWTVLVLFLFRTRVGQTLGITPTDSLVERFGLFTLIVLGGVVFGVVAGLSAAHHDVTTIVTGLVALVVGFGFWWIYFDVVGGRLPQHDGRAIATWIVSHCPITLSIAAAGAGMISLIEHAHAARTPEATAWLLTGAVAVGLLGVIVTANSLVDARHLVAAYRPLSTKLAIGAVAGAIVGWARPAPWLLALLLVVILSALWAVAVRGFLLANAWGEEPSSAD